jgi:hypothetical protein
MSSHDPRPRWARMQPLAGLIVALCAALLAFGASAAADSSQPVATSAALRTAAIARVAVDKTLASSSKALKACLRKHPKGCQADRRAVRRTRAQLTSLDGRISRYSRHHGGQKTKATNPPAPTPTTPIAPVTAPKSESPAGKGSGPGNAGGSTGSSGASTEGIGSGSSTSGAGTSESPVTSEPGTSSAPFDEPFVKGIVTNIQGWGVSAVPQIASEMTTLGVNWAREDLSWAETEPQKGVFDWSSFDQMVEAAKAHGITVLPIVGYAPSWTSPNNATEYAAFVKAAVERYGPGTSANLQWWELWNEPYDSYAWSGQTPEPEAYARDVLAAAQAARGVSSSVKLLVAADYNDSPQTGGTTPWETSWIDDMFAAVPNLGQWINGVAVHPYGDDPSLPLAQPEGWKDANGEWAFQRIDMIHQKFLNHGVNVPFWITEEGWSTWEVSEATQAKDYADLIEQVKLRPWIRALFPYCLREFNEHPTNNQSGYGLLKFGTWQPKQAFYTLQAGLKTLN